MSKQAVQFLHAKALAAHVKLFSNSIRSFAFAITLAVVAFAPASAYSQEVSTRELTKAIAEKVDAVEEFRFMRDEAAKRNVKIYLFGGTAAAYAHYVKWDLLRTKGDSRFQGERFDYDFTNIYRSTQDLDIVVDGDHTSIADLHNVLKTRFPQFQGDKDAWEVRSLKEDYKGKIALLNNPDFLNQNTDSNSVGLISLQKDDAEPVRDLKEWDNTESQFIKDIATGTLHYYDSDLHDKTRLALEGRNPKIISAIRYVIKAVQFGLTIPDREMSTIKELITKFEPSNISGNAQYIRTWMENNGKKLVQNAVDLEYAWNLTEELGLRKKLISLSNPGSVNSMGWLLSREPLRSKPLATTGQTARELGLSVVAHETNSFIAYESITRSHIGFPNALISRAGHPGEAAVHGDGFYTRRGTVGARGTGLTIRFKMNPEARLGQDFTMSGDYIVVTNKSAMTLIPEPMTRDLNDAIQRLLILDQNDKAYGHRLIRRITNQLSLVGGKDVVRTLERTILATTELTAARELLLPKIREFAVRTSDRPLMDKLLKHSKDMIASGKWNKDWVATNLTTPIESKLDEYRRPTERMLIYESQFFNSPTGSNERVPIATRVRDYAVASGDKELLKRLLIFSLQMANSNWSVPWVESQIREPALKRLKEVATVGEYYEFVKGLCFTIGTHDEFRFRLVSEVISGAVKTNDQAALFKLMDGASYQLTDAHKKLIQPVLSALQKMMPVPQYINAIERHLLQQPKFIFSTDALVAELVSIMEVRLPDGTTKEIDLGTLIRILEHSSRKMQGDAPSINTKIILPILKVIDAVVVEPKERVALFSKTVLSTIKWDANTANSQLVAALVPKFLDDVIKAGDFQTALVLKGHFERMSGWNINWLNPLKAKLETGILGNIQKRPGADDKKVAFEALEYTQPRFVALLNLIALGKEKKDSALLLEILAHLDKLAPVWRTQNVTDANVRTNLFEAMKQTLPDIKFKAILWNYAFIKEKSGAAFTTALDFLTDYAIKKSDLALAKKISDMDVGDDKDAVSKLNSVRNQLRGLYIQQIVETFEAQLKDVFNKKDGGAAEKVFEVLDKALEAGDASSINLQVQMMGLRSKYIVEFLLLQPTTQQLVTYAAGIDGVIYSEQTWIQVLDRVTTPAHLNAILAGLKQLPNRFSLDSKLKIASHSFNKLQEKGFSFANHNVLRDAIGLPMTAATSVNWKKGSKPVSSGGGVCVDIFGKAG
jgi:hypothetical protein